MKGGVEVYELRSNLRSVWFTERISDPSDCSGMWVSKESREGDLVPDHSGESFQGKGF